MEPAEARLYAYYAVHQLFAEEPGSHSADAA